MKITFLTPDNTLKTLSRVRMLEKAVSKSYETEIIAVTSGKKEKDFYRENFPNYKNIIYDPGKIFADLQKNINGDLIYVIRAATYSLGLAASIKQRKKVPLLLDLDQVESYNRFPYTDSLGKGILFSLFSFNNPDSYLYTKLVEKRIKYTDWITTSSKYLQGRFGGSLIPKFCDSEVFDPDKYQIAEIRKALGWNDEKIILYCGEIKPEQDWEKIIQSIKDNNLPKVKICLVGPENNYSKKLSQKSQQIIFYNYQPQENIAKMMSAADLYLLPQLNSLKNSGKMSASLYEAMASKLTVIAFSVADNEEILSGCGEIIPDGDYRLLGQKVRNLIEDEKKKENLGFLARKKCQEEYSSEQFTEKLLEVIDKRIKVGADGRT